MKTHTEPAREIPVAHEVDVLVVGGGLAGVAAAICARRLGARTRQHLEHNLGATGWRLAPAHMDRLTRTSQIDPLPYPYEFLSGLEKERGR